MANFPQFEHFDDAYYFRILLSDASLVLSDVLSSISLVAAVVVEDLVLADT
jgi:hypothetical protein